MSLLIASDLKGSNKTTDSVQIWMSFSEIVIVITGVFKCYLASR